MNDSSIDPPVSTVEPDGAATCDQPDGGTADEPSGAATLQQPVRTGITDALIALIERDDSRKILEDLIQLRRPSGDVVRHAHRLQVLPDPFGRPVTMLRRADLRRVLGLYRSGDMRWDKVQAWSEAVLLHVSAPVDRPYIAVERGSRADLLIALAGMSDTDEPKSEIEFGLLWAMTREDNKRVLDQPWCAAVGAMAAVGLWFAARAVWDLPAAIPPEPRLIGSLAVAGLGASVVLAWATAGVRAACRLVEFWAALFAIAAVVVTVFDFGLLT